MVQVASSARWAARRVLRLRRARRFGLAAFDMNTVVVVNTNVVKRLVRKKFTLMICGELQTSPSVDGSGCAS